MHFNKDHLKYVIFFILFDKNNFELFKTSIRYLFYTKILI